METGTVRIANPGVAGMIELCRQRPDEDTVLTFRSIEARVDVRRRVRAAFNIAFDLGADVRIGEDRHLLGSVYAVRLRGTGRQLLPALLALRVI